MRGKSLKGSGLYCKCYSRKVSAGGGIIDFEFLILDVGWIGRCAEFGILDFGLVA
jgi:hypothetical protein